MGIKIQSGVDSSITIEAENAAGINATVTIPNPTVGDDATTQLLTQASLSTSQAIETGAIKDLAVTNDKLAAGAETDGAKFLAGDSTWKTVTVPTNNNELTNGAGYITSAPAGFTWPSSAPSTQTINSSATGTLSGGAGWYWYVASNNMNCTVNGTNTPGGAASDEIKGNPQLGYYTPNGPSITNNGSAGNIHYIKLA